MTSTRKSSKYKAFAVAIAACLAFILCPLFSIYYINKGTVSSADGTVGDEVGVRFVQIAAGEDFAIGLTYDSDLYGWSLLSSGHSKSADEAKTLGEYYTPTPTRIDYKLQNGPTGTNSVPNWGDTSARGYHGEKTPKTASTMIKQIVATRYTAAFITVDGYIYTWGIDDTSVKTQRDIEYASGTTSYPHNLLLRSFETKNSSYPSCWYMPYIINYGYYETSSGGVTSSTSLRQLIPGGDGLANLSIAAGEYNYIVAFTKSGSTYTYSWGSLMYIATNYDHTDRWTGYNLLTDMNSDVHGGASQQRYVFQLSNSEQKVTAVAGGYTLGVNNTSASTGETSLWLKGKNFLTSAGVNDDGTITNTTKVSDQPYSYGPAGEVTAKGQSNIKFGDVTYANAIIGGRHAADSIDTATITPEGDARLFYGAQYYNSSTAGLSFSSLNSEKNKIHDSRNKALDTIESSTDVGTITWSASPVMRFSAALGNDIGYGYNSAGALYAWGDNSLGQLPGVSGSKNEPTATNIESGVVSIAAGKQLTGEEVDSPKVFNSSSTFATSGATTGAFNSDAQNVKEYISAVLLSTGKIKAWGCTKQNAADNATVSDDNIYFAGSSAANTSTDGTKNYFVAVYSGYGNNLFAVNAQGQAVRITIDDNKFKQEVYDAFCETRGGDPVKNWSVAADGVNKLTFRVDSNALKDNNVPDLGKAIVYVDSVNALLDTIQLNKQNPNQNTLSYSGDRKSLVTENKSGNAYRILSPDTYDKSKFITDSLSSTPDESLPDNVNLKFYYSYDGKATSRELMSDKQLKNMFGKESGAEFVYYNDGTFSGVGIEIAPVQSTKGGVVTVEFYVARYDNAANFTVTNGGANNSASKDNAHTDKALYYDVQKCYIDIEVENTPTYVKYQPFYGNAVPDSPFNDGNCKIPLLDPNNAALKYFSIPAFDVMSGITELSGYISALELNNAQGTIRTSIIDAIKYSSTNVSGDRGFPEASKVSAGNLDYYLNDADVALFNDSYPFYLLEDRDGDVTSLITPTKIGDGVNVTVQNIKISVALPTGCLPTDMTIAQANAKLYREFNNLFGFYDLAIEEKDSGIYLNFTYDVLRFEATGSTGSLVYSSTDSTTKVDSYSTINSNENDYVNVHLSLREFPYYDADYKTWKHDSKALADISKSNVATAFSQPSLRFTKNDVLYYGDSSATDNNQMTINYTEGTTVMAGCDPITINLAGYFGFNPGTNIRYSYEGTTTKYGDFNKQFRDETGSGTEIVTLSGMDIIVRPTTTAPINFTVTIQRFHGNATAFEQKDGFGNDERITVTFSFATIQPFTFKWVGMNSYIDVTGGGGTIDVLGGDTTLNKARLIQTSAAKYDSMIKMSGLSSSNPSVLTVSSFEGSVTRTSFTVTPHASGTAVVQFILTILNKSVVCSLSFNVSAVTALTDSINLIDTSYIYVNSIITELKRSNSFRNDIDSFGIVYEDTGSDDSVPADEADLPRAVYFTRKDNGNRERPKFVKSVSFVDAETTNPRMRIELDDQENDLAGEYVMHLRYINKDRNYKTYQEAVAAGADVLETTESIRSSKKIVLDKSTNSIYTVAINVDAPKEAPEGGTKADWYTIGSNTKMTVMIPVRYLLVGIVDNPDEYNIFLVSAASNAANYFNYSFNANNEIVVTPQYNTPINEDNIREAINVNVSVAPSNPQSNIGNQILSFRISVEGISETLSLEEYRTIWLVAFFSSLGLLIIIFVIRLIVYWRRRAKQRALIKRNQELIRMRDRIHNKSTQATREQIVRSRMKMQDPKYAKMVNDMRKERDGDSSGVTVDSGMGVVSEPGKKGKKKKKGGKKSIAELKAELEAKKAAFAQAQSGAQPIDVPLDGQGFAQGGYGMPDQGYAAPDPGFADPGGYGSPADAFAAQDLDANAIIFDSPDDGMQG